MIQELLNTGKANAMTTTQIMTACGFKHIREVSRQIEHERADGAIICSTTSEGGGYYLPADRMEIAEFVGSMDRRAKNIFKAVKSAKRFLKIPEGQFDFDNMTD
ncbi:MAG: hypothetical protein IJ526_12750 [Lachnospiraceae bacterium]|nr:hypothetical protein [Lachnospiraceae bacterium]